MRTIKLENNNKKIFVLLRNIIFIILFIFLFFKYFSFTYEYYYISENKEYISIGLSNEKDLIDKTVLKYLDEVKNNNINIADFNLVKSYGKRIKIIFKKDLKEEKNDIENNIKQNIYIKIYGIVINYNDNNYYFLENQEEEILEILEDKNFNIKKNFFYLHQLSSIENLTK